MTAAYSLDRETEPLSRKPPLGEKRPRLRLVWDNPKLTAGTHKEKSEVRLAASYGRVLYNYYRYYDPNTGRYITSDPIGLAGGLNTYGNVGGNPLGFIDLFGLCFGGGCHEPPSILFPIPFPAPSKMGSVPDSNAGSSTGAETGTDNSGGKCCTSYYNVYKANDGKHGRSPRTRQGDRVSPLPSNGQATLGTSTSVSPTQRMGFDPITNEIVIFRLHRTDNTNCIRYWHGYVVRISDLTIDQWRTGRGAGYPKWPRKPK